jgi:hypothetical protein
MLDISLSGLSLSPELWMPIKFWPIGVNFADILAMLDAQICPNKQLFPLAQLILKIVHIARIHKRFWDKLKFQSVKCASICRRIKLASRPGNFSY